MSIWSKFQLPSTSKPSKDYTDVTAWLFQQFPSYQVIGAKAYKPTLENITKLLDRFDNPQNKLSFIHIAGSNGKGSVCSMLSSIFTESGKKVGLFTSPHIFDFTERIRINGNCIDQQSVVDFVKEVRSTPLDFDPSFFEITFAMAIVHFANENVDLCIIETGLGGRLDATNVISPICSAITSISLEHTAILGDTIEEIAREKGGIIKASTPVCLGDLDPISRKELKAIAHEKDAPIIYFSHHDHTFTLPFIADYQIANFDLVLNVLSTVNVDFPTVDSDIQKGLDNLFLNTGFIGRLQVLQDNPTVILDVSHNPEGIAKSVNAIMGLNGGRLRIIYGTSQDKDAEEIVKSFPDNSLIYLTTFSNPRSRSKQDLIVLSDSMSLSTKVFDSPKIAYKEAIENAAKNDIIWITGSFFLVADFF